MNKLLVFDIDGTLVDSASKLPQTNIDAIKRAVDAGCKIAINSGRPPFRITPFFEKMGLLNDNSYLVSLNGGLVCNATMTDVPFCVTLKQELARKAIKLAEDNGLHVLVYTDNVVYQDEFSVATNYLSNEACIKTIHSFKPLYDINPVYKVLIHSETENIQKLVDKLDPSFYDEYYVCRTVPCFLEFMPYGCSKGSGLKKLREHLGIDFNDVISFGDEVNDLELFEESGIGVAMGNARDEIKEKADYVTDTNNNQGIPKAIGELIFNERFYLDNNILVSSCLLGNNTKYNGGNNLNLELKEFLKDKKIITVCPETYGKLPVPRDPAEQIGNKVVLKNGTDVTNEFNLGSSIALKKALKYHVRYAILKERSPSCGVMNIYDGTFTGTKILGQGVCTKLLLENGIICASEENYKEIIK